MASNSQPPNETRITFPVAVQDSIKVRHLTLIDGSKAKDVPRDERFIVNDREHDKRMTAIGAIKDHLALINHPCFLLSLKEGDSTESSARKIDLVATMADCVEDIIGDLTDLAELDIQKRSGNWWPDGVEFLKKEARYHKRLHEGLRKHQELCENLRVLSGQYLKLHPRGDSVSVEEY